MKKTNWRTLRSPKDSHLVRIETRESNSTPIEIIPGDQAPEIEGHYGYHTTPSGKTIVHSPRAYGYATVYHCSTRKVIVGEGWISKVREQLSSPPKGYAWDRDSLGIKLVANHDGEDWHLSPAAIAKGRFMTSARKGLAKKRRENRQLREAEKRERIAREKYLADSATTRVSLADSLAAGNCPDGSLRFAEIKLGLTRKEVLDRKHDLKVPASTLRARANGQTREVEKAIARAYARETLVQI